MSMVARYMNRPHLLTSLVVLAAVVGLVGYRRMPVNLFPDSERPQIAVVTVVPGASAEDVERDVSRVVEKELSSIEQVRRVVSVNKDEASTVTAEFEYVKGLDSAATDVANAVQRIKASLPEMARPSMIFKISSATSPVLTLALRPAAGSALDLATVREFADNAIKERLLQLGEVANVEVFGGHQPIVRVDLSRDRLERYRLTAADVRQALAAFNANQPIGLLVSSDTQFLMKRIGQFTRPDEIARIPVAQRPGGDVHLAEVGDVRMGEQEPQSAYHANGMAAIAINVQRAPTGNALRTIAEVASALPGLQRDYPGIDFSIPDSQNELIDRAVGNMLDALRDAIIMTVLVIFLFLADWRGMTLAAVSIPFTYLLTFAAMWLGGFEFNMVTLTAIVVAVGMLLDDAIVVLENIERHYHEVGRGVREAVVGGTEEVMVAIFSGTYATIMVLLPIIFIGGYVQTVMRPLAMTLSIALVASYVVSVTVIPLLAPWLLRRRAGGRNRFERLVFMLDRYGLGPVRDFYVRLTGVALRHRALFVAGALILLVVSMRQMPLIGRDLMPPMDAGIVKVAFETDANSSLAATEAALARMEHILCARPEVTSVSSVVGSEPAVLSFGGGRLPQQGVMTVHLVDRFHRTASIWDIEAAVRPQLQRIQGVRAVDVYDFGATPLSTIRAPIDVMIAGPDIDTLDRLGTEVERRLRERVRGLTSVSRSWHADSVEQQFVADADTLALYGISPAALAGQLQASVRGGAASAFRVPNEDGLPIWVQMKGPARTSTSALASYPVMTSRGPVPLATLGRFIARPAPAVITRQGLQRTLDVQAYRGRVPISHLQEDVDAALKDLALPPGYAISQEGEIKQMDESFRGLLTALALGLVLLYFSLVPAFRSWLHPLTIMSAIPLALIGALWSMLAFNKHSCMPSFMGLILLAGIVVKNSILLIDFIIEARGRGESLQDALVGSVRVRTRPILMTAVGTAVGMLPIAGEWAIGLERLSPLAIAAIGGLLVSTFLTMIYVPVFYSLFEDLQRLLKREPRPVSAPAPVQGVV
jgi:multidrug efflux pump subunit AcrB